MSRTPCLVRARSLAIAFTLSSAAVVASCRDGADPGSASSFLPATSQRDAKGVWFVSGGSLATQFEAMGYSVATDRLWQLELFRRNARGRLAEVFGASQLGTDILTRTTGYTDAELTAGFAGLDGDSRTVVEAYVAGINRRLFEVYSNPAKAPFEFLALGFLPEEWTGEDVMALSAAVQRTFDIEAMDSGQLDNAALLQELAARFPADHLGMFDDLRWINDPDAPTMIPSSSGVAASDTTSRASSGDQSIATRAHREKLAERTSLSSAARALRHRRREYVENLRSIQAYVKMGSYAWAVSGSKTSSGHPILYSGPQMGFSTPSVIVEGSIDAANLSVSGMTIPGLPGFVIGRTRHHAWSMQVGHAHSTDYYLEDASSVVLDRVETIEIAGAAPMQLPVYRSPRGPIVEPSPYDPSQPADAIVSWRYANRGHEFDIVAAMLGFARAKSVDQFGAAVERLAVSQHICYASVDDDIAYWMSGRDPVRAASADPRVVQLGDGTQDWPTPLAYKPRAHDRNPTQGYYAGWNNKARADYDNPTNVISLNGRFHRGHAIQDYLDAHDDLTFAEVRDLALDVACTGDSLDEGGNPWKFVSARFRSAVQASPTPARLAALAMLDAWGGHFVPGGPGQWPTAPTRDDAWVLQDEWIREVLRLTFADELDTAMLTYLDQPTSLLFNVLLRALDGPSASLPNHYDWFRNAGAIPLPTTADQIIVLALDHTLAALGPAPYGVARGTIDFTHDILGPIWSTPYSNRSTYAQCVELGPDGPVRIESLLPLGQSGDVRADGSGTPVFDTHFLSRAAEFDSFRPRPFPRFR